MPTTTITTEPEPMPNPQPTVTMTIDPPVSCTFQRIDALALAA